MNDEPDIDMLAAEYVLGTLEPAQRAVIAERRVREPELERAIADWEQRLSPLNDTVFPVSPSPNLLSKIEARIFADPERKSNATANEVKIGDQRRRATRWRAVALAASTVAACLAAFIIVHEATRAPARGTYVAIFQQGDASPAFLLSIDLETRALTIRAVAAQLPADKSFQLWIASPQLGSGPRPLAVLDNAEPTTKLVIPYDPQLVRNATFGVSLEPLGGSPTGLPTGPVFHARLIPASG